MAKSAQALSEAPAVRCRFPGDVRRAAGLAARRAPFPSRRSARRRTLAELFDLAALAPSVGNCQPTRLRARRRRGAPGGDPRQFRGRQPRSAQRPMAANGPSFTPGSSLRACAMRRSNSRCSATRRRSRAMASAPARCRRRAAIRPSARCTPSGLARAPEASASAGSRFSIRPQSPTRSTFREPGRSSPISVWVFRGRSI